MIKQHVEISEIPETNKNGITKIYKTYKEACWAGIKIKREGWFCFDNRALKAERPYKGKYVNIRILVIEIKTTAEEIYSDLGIRWKR